MAQRKNESGENFVNIGLKVTPAARDALNDIGIEQDRPLGYVARKLVMRGLAAYHRDRLLDEPAHAAKPLLPRQPMIPTQVKVAPEASESVQNMTEKAKHR